jgi:hypothetical protein
MFIRYCMVRPTGDCAVKADPSQPFHTSGTVDAAFGGAYYCSLLVGNQLVPRADPNRAVSETARIEIYEAKVSILDESGTSILSRNDGSTAEYTVPLNGFVDPGNASTPGYGLVDVEMVDPVTIADYGKKLKPGATQQLVASVVLHGRTLGGNELESDEWTFPITVCNGCLCNQGPCQTNASDMPGPLACTPGADALVDCRYNLVGCGDCRIDNTCF